MVPVGTQRITPGLPLVAQSCEGQFCQAQKGTPICADHQRADALRLRSGILKIVKSEDAFPGRARATPDRVAFCTSILKTVACMDPQAAMNLPCSMLTLAKITGPVRRPPWTLWLTHVAAKRQPPRQLIKDQQTIKSTLIWAPSWSQDDPNRTPACCRRTRPRRCRSRPFQW